VHLDRAVTWATVVEAARRHGRIAVGYRVGAASQDRASGYGITFDPRRSSVITFRRDDRLIVIAADNEGTVPAAIVPRPSDAVSSVAPGRDLDRSG
jgi:hypothetical protein